MNTIRWFGDTWLEAKILMMVTKAEKVFFSVVIAFILGTAIFWKEVRTFLSGSSAVNTEASDGKNEAKKKTKEEKNAIAGTAANTLRQWRLPSDMKEISGLVAVANSLWAVSDNPKKPVLKLDGEGNTIQQLNLEGIALEDAEALTSDGKYLYIGDVGDNKGDREVRKIYRVALSTLGTDKEVKASAEVITFSFEGQTIAEKKKENEFDCEAMFFHNGSLYLFTKRRTDKDTEVFRLPATAGNHEAKSLGVFETAGMITGGAINASGTEVALTGYHKGHAFPFILLLKNFTGDAFFGGTVERIELASEKLDWQVESITYAGDEMLYFSNEDTKDVPATLYHIRRQDIGTLHQKRE